MIAARLNLADTRTAYFFAGFMSLLLSFWIGYHQTVINPDAVCYLLSASEVGKGGINAAMHLCGQASWPFYSVLIYAFSKITLLSLTTSAYVLDGLLTFITVLTFLSIVEMLGGSRRVLWLAAFVILTSHQFNSVRQYIVRDHGFWAFYLLSFLFMLRFLSEQTLKNALGFSLSLVMAALFRIEGVVFLAVVPFLAFMNGGSLGTRLISFLKLNVVGITAAVLLVLAVLWHPQLLNKLGRVPELFNQLVNGYSLILFRYAVAKGSLVAHVLPAEAARDAGMVWVAVLIGLYFANIINNLSWVAAILVGYAWLSGVTARFTREAKLVLYGYLAINAVVLAIFFAQRIFFAKRYLIALILVLLLWVPFALDKLLREPGSRQRVLAYIAMLALFISSLGVITNTGTSKHYIREAGDWLGHNLPPASKFYTNDIQLAYYANQYGNTIFDVMQDQRKDTAMPLQAYDYAALRIGKNKEEAVASAVKAARAELLHVFENKNGDQVTIYKIPRQAD
jgi:hypothetical protein